MDLHNFLKLANSASDNLALATLASAHLVKRKVALANSAIASLAN